MANPYREIFRAPGTVGFATAGFMARLPMAMVPMGLVAMLSQTHGEYWLAGAASAVFTLTNALISPQISRLVDRYGQRRILVPATIISVLAFVLLLAATHFRWPSWTVFAFAVLAAVMPSMPAMIRARWTEIYRDTPQLNTAFAFESIADEVLYMTGSVLSVGLSVAWFPEAGPLVATVFLTIGTALFVVQTGTEPRAHPVIKAQGTSALASCPLQIITFTLITIGVLFGTAEVTVIAMAEMFGAPAAASLILASYAGGSLAVGLVFGLLKLRVSLARQFALAVFGAAVTTLPLLFIGNIPMLMLYLFLAGAAISPAFITAFALIERRIPAGKLTEGITWAVTGIGIGMAVGSFASGYVIDAFGPPSGFWVSVAAGAAALATVILGFGALSGRGRAAKSGPAVMPGE